MANANVSRETIESLLSSSSDIERLRAYHDILATEAVTLGLLGPREANRIWDRHIGNSLWVVLPPPHLVPIGASVADVGSGAGLPGLAWAIARPDLTVTLIEPLLRRAEFLHRSVSVLGLADRVAVVRDRAENLRGQCWDIVTARAVAPLDRLLEWTLPLVSPNGCLVALKGTSVNEELEAARSTLRRHRAGEVLVVEGGGRIGGSATRAVVVPRSRHARG